MDNLSRKIKKIIRHFSISIKMLYLHFCCLMHICTGIDFNGRERECVRARVRTCERMYTDVSTLGYEKLSYSLEVCYWNMIGHGV